MNLEDFATDGLVWRFQLPQRHQLLSLRGAADLAGSLLSASVVHEARTSLTARKKHLLVVVLVLFEMCGLLTVWPPSHEPGRSSLSSELRAGARGVHGTSCQRIPKAVHDIKCCRDAPNGSVAEVVSIEAMFLISSQPH